jgi:hypothetical protein
MTGSEISFLSIEELIKKRVFTHNPLAVVLCEENVST